MQPFPPLVERVDQRTSRGDVHALDLVITELAGLLHWRTQRVVTVHDDERHAGHRATREVNLYLEHLRLLSSCVPLPYLNQYLLLLAMQATYSWGDAHMGLMSNFVYDLSTNAFVHRKHLQLIPTGQIIENIFAIRTGSANLFIYKKGLDWIAIDSGFGSSILKREFSFLGINPNKITSLFLTHSDFDHASGLPVFQNAQIYLSSNEEPMITRKMARKYGIIYNKRINRAYKLLKDNDEVAVGIVKVRAIETPGHTVSADSQHRDHSPI